MKVIPGREKTFILLLFILPVLFVYTSHLFVQAKGAYYANPDAEYKYLFSSLDVAKLRPVKFVDHPGSPLQVIGAAVIRTRYIFKGQEKTLEYDVVAHPEQYLLAINCFLIAITVAILTIGGYFIFNLTKSIWYALIYQLSLFSSTTTLRISNDVNTELLLVFLALFLSCTLFYVSTIPSDSAKKYISGWVFPVLIALGIATKLSFAPFAIIPFLLLPSWKSKAVYLLKVLFLFVLFIFPAWSYLSYLYEWGSGILLHSSQYGTGKADIVNAGEFMKNGRTILLSEPMFAANYLLMCMAAIYYRLQKKSELQNAFALAVLCAVLIAIFIQCLLVLKHFSPRYLIPSYILCFCGNGILLQIMLSDLPVHARLVKFPVFKYLFILLLVAGVGFRYRKTVLNLNTSKQEYANILKMHEFENSHYLKNKKIYFFGVGNLPFALHYGVGHSTAPMSDYSEKLFQMYPNVYFYSPSDFNLLTDQTGKYHDWNHKPISLNRIAEKPDTIIIVGWEGLFRNEIPSDRKIVEMHKSGNIVLFESR